MIIKYEADLIDSIKNKNLKKVKYIFKKYKIGSNELNSIIQHFCKDRILDIQILLLYILILKRENL